MKALIVTIIVSLLLATNATGQAQKRLRTPQNLPADQQPLVLVNSMETSLSNFWISPEKIESIQVLKDSASVAIYGDKGKNGVLIIKVKPETELVSLADLISQYNISIKDRDLKICRDKVLVTDKPDKIFLDKAEVVKIEVITDIYWVTPMIAGSEERFINITLKGKY